MSSPAGVGRRETTFSTLLTTYSWVFKFSLGSQVDSNTSPELIEVSHFFVLSYTRGKYFGSSPACSTIPLTSPKTCGRQLDLCSEWSKTLQRRTRPYLKSSQHRSAICGTQFSHGLGMICAICTIVWFAIGFRGA